MKLEIVDNISRDMATLVCASIEQSTDTRIAVAFVSSGGLAIIRPSVTRALAAGACIEFLVGFDIHLTEPQAVQALYDISRSDAALRLYCYVSLTPAAIYHPKIYIFRADEQVKFIVGSSNLTQGGLKKNLEVNVAIQANAGNEEVSDVYGTYNQMKFHPNRVTPDQELLALYAQLWSRERDNRQRRSPDEASRQLARALRQKAIALGRPTASRADLVGWLELVYDSLPDGEFTNQQLYLHERAFRQHYPGNRNVSAKIRQQLQMLRDMGLVEHLGHARWKKL